MLARCLILTVGLLAAGVAVPADASAAAETFRGYTSKTGKYKVKFPQRAELTESLSEPEDGPTTYNVFGLVPSPKAVYAVMYFDIAKRPTTASAAKRTVNEMGEALRGKGKLVSSEELELEDETQTGKEWLVELSNAHFRYRVILKDKRAYHIALMAEDEDSVTGTDADKFFNSFAVLEDEKPKSKPKPKVDDDEPAPRPKPKPKVDDDDEPVPPKPKPKLPPKPPVDDPR